MKAAVLATTTLAHGQFDQIGALDGSDLIGGAVASQIFEVAFSIYDVAAIDNFTVPDGGMSITEFAAMLSGFGGYQGTHLITGYNIGIYSSPIAASTSMLLGGPRVQRSLSG